ncbi:MAG: lipopolysaccharide heptosyltransferase II [Pseudomonadota bacterium]
MKILIVAPAWVGDMVMAQPLIALLVSRGAELSVVAPPATAPLGERLPGVSAVYPLEVGHGELGLGRRWRLARQLRRGAFDQAIVLPNSLKSALLPLFAGVPRRTGWLGESRYGLLNDHRHLDPDRYPLMVQRFLALGLPPGAEPVEVRAPVLKVDAERAATLMASLGLAAGNVTALCPGAEFGPAKRWPAEHYAAVARHELDQGRGVWLMGSPGDAEACAAIAALAPGVMNLAGRTRLLDAVDLLAQAERVVCNDSGLMHVACALKRPVVAVFGSTSPGFTPPLNDQAQVLKLDLECSPCFARECPLGHLNCLKTLEPERVIEALR